MLKNLHYIRDVDNVCAHVNYMFVYLNRHDSTYVPRRQFGSLRIKFDCESLSLATGQILHSFKLSAETLE